MWPFEKVLWWYYRPKGSPKDHHGEMYQRQLRMRCKKALDAILHLSIVSQGSAHGSSNFMVSVSQVVEQLSEKGPTYGIVKLVIPYVDIKC